MDNLKISAFIRLRNAQHTIKSCILSIIDDIDEIIVIDNMSTDNSISIIRQLECKKIKIHVWPFKLVTPWTKEAHELKEGDPRSKITFSNFAMEQCSNDWVLKWDSDMVMVPDGMKAILATKFTKPFLALGGYEVISPSWRTSDFSGEEPRFWNRTLDGGLKFQKYFDTGGEIIWSNKWDMGCKSWGPWYESLGKGPFWMHYGWVRACDPQRPYKNFGLTPLDIPHHPEIQKNLDNIFSQKL